MVLTSLAPLLPKWVRAKSEAAGDRLLLTMLRSAREDA
jgi:hypothetical protein